MVFARGTSDSLISLVKKIDAASTSKNIYSLVVFLSDDEELGDHVRDLAAKERIKKTILAIDNAVGPKAYRIAKDADVTVVFYNKRKVEANHAFKKGELNAKSIEKALADIPKITAAQR